MVMNRRKDGMSAIEKGARLMVVNRDSGEITFFEVTQVLGQRWWARKIRESEAGSNPGTIFVRQGGYGF
jgi:hypothetical protein